jgi:anti-anti-sigma factor
MIAGTNGQPRDPEPTVEVTWPESGLALVVLGGEQDMGSAPAVAAAIEDAFGTCSHLVIDLSAVQFIDSSIINLLMVTRREADDRGCEFSLVLPGAASAERTLEICGVLPGLNRVTTLGAATTNGRPA